MKERERSAGVLMPVFSLPGEYGIGTFGKEAKQFIDFLKETGNSVWQVLPMGPTGYGDSPYQSFSSFAINPYFIDLETLEEEGFLTEEELHEEKLAFASSEEKIRYGLLYERRFPLLRKAYERWKAAGGNASLLLSNLQKETLDYCLFMALKEEYASCPWQEFPEALRNKEASAVQTFLEEHREDVACYAFMQKKAEEQWRALRDYAKECGVQILGDLPIYCAMDSADVWGNRKMFDFSEGEKGYPGFIAGVPPDAFSETGQLWGNPLYDWDTQKKEDYLFWCKRMEYCFRLYDILRVDHFRGFASYYAVPFAAEDAIHGEWRKGPGKDLFSAFHRYFQKERLPVIAEDLGVITDDVKELMQEVGYPGMKVLQFAFGSDYENTYLPHTFTNDCSVMYTGTHDNDTLTHWFQTIGDWERGRIYHYLSRSENDWNAMPELLIKEAMSSTSYLCIIPIPDYLNLQEEGRINAPGTDQGNWQWRMKKEAFSVEKKQLIRDMLETYGRNRKEREK